MHADLLFLRGCAGAQSARSPPAVLVVPSLADRLANRCRIVPDARLVDGWIRTAASERRDWAWAARVTRVHGHGSGKRGFSVHGRYPYATRRRGWLFRDEFAPASVM